MASTASRPSFFIVYGWISGSGHGWLLRKKLVAAGYVSANNMQSADIIITHSAGFFLLPSNLSQKLIIMVGPTLNKITVGNWLHANMENARMFWKDRHILQGIGLNLLHIADAVFRIGHNARIAKAARTATLPSFSKNHVILIANRDDPWPKPSDMNDFIEQNPWVFLSLSGAHENIWEQPEKYVEVIRQYAK